MVSGRPATDTRERHLRHDPRNPVEPSFCLAGPIEPQPEIANLPLHDLRQAQASLPPSILRAGVFPFGGPEVDPLSVHVGRGGPFTIKLDVSGTNLGRIRPAPEVAIARG